MELYITQGLRGGIGKSLAAYLFARALIVSKVQFNYAEIDDVNKLSDMLAPKAPAFVKSMSPDISDANTTIDDFDSHFIDVLDINKGTNNEVALLDLGAGVSKRFQQWTRKVQFTEFAESLNVKANFIEVATTEIKTLKTSLSDLNETIALFGHKANYTLVINDMHNLSLQSVQKNKSVMSQINTLKSEYNLNVVFLRHLEQTKMTKYMRVYDYAPHRVVSLYTRTRKLIETKQTLDDNAKHLMKHADLYVRVNNKLNREASLQRLIEDGESLKEWYQKGVRQFLNLQSHNK